MASDAGVVYKAPGDGLVVAIDWKNQPELTANGGPETLQSGAVSYAGTTSGGVEDTSLVLGAVGVVGTVLAALYSGGTRGSYYKLTWVATYASTHTRELTSEVQM